MSCCCGSCFCCCGCCEEEPDELYDQHDPEEQRRRTKRKYRDLMNVAFASRAFKSGSQQKDVTFRTVGALYANEVRRRLSEYSINVVCGVDGTFRRCEPLLCIINYLTRARTQPGVVQRLYEQHELEPTRMRFFVNHLVNQLVRGEMEEKIGLEGFIIGKSEQ